MIGYKVHAIQLDIFMMFVALEKQSEMQALVIEPLIFTLDSCK